MNKSSQKLQVVLADAESAGRVIVNLEAFFQFNHRMNVSLASMVEKWAHLAAPKAILDDRRYELRR